MITASDARVVAQLALGRAYVTYHAVLRRDPLMSLFTAAGRRDPYPLLERVRARGPLMRSSTGALGTADHAVVDAILRSRDTSVHVQGNTASGVIDLSLLELDPPDHTRLRALVAPAFTARRMRDQEGPISAAVERLVDDLARRLQEGPVDLMAAYAKPLPVVMITALLGVPDAEIAALNRYGDAIGSALDGVQSVRHARELATARHNLNALFDRLVERRRAEPTDDLVSQLATAEGAGRLTRDELLPLVNLVLVAGFETTVNLLGNAVSALLDRPGAWQRLVDDPGLAERVVDETLRWDPPVQLTGRSATADLDAAGHAIPAGTSVILLLAGANRDPAVFPNPGEFSLDRPNPREHLAFSSGIHHCVGRPLAELEARLALAALARRLPGLRRAAPETMGTGVVLHGRRTLPVRL